MSETLITGATGTLGKALCKLLTDSGVDYIIGSRRPANTSNRVQFDLLKNTGVKEALQEKKTIIHLAHDLKNDSKVTENLINGIDRKAGTRIIYISIVGIDKVPTSYYRQKLLSEQILIRSGIPYSILRATQFHDFIDKNLSLILKFPVVFLPKKILLQPVQIEVVAQQLLELLQQPPTSRIDNLGGAQTHTLAELIAAWKKAKSNHSIILNLPLWGVLGKSLIAGNLTLQQCNKESVEWPDWLKRKCK